MNQTQLLNGCYYYCFELKILKLDGQINRYKPTMNAKIRIEKQVKMKGLRIIKA